MGDHCAIFFTIASLISAYPLISAGISSNVSLLIEPSVIIEGGSMTVTCTLATERGQVDTLSITSPITDSVCTSDCLIINDCGFEPEQCTCDSLAPRGDGYCPVETNDVSYTVSGVTIELKGMWTCQSYISGESATFCLTVYKKSSDPLVSGNTNTTMGKVEELQCSSKGGSPPAHFEWFIVNGTDQINISHNSSSEDDENVLFYTAQKIHNGSDIVCKVTQDGLPDERCDRKPLTVMFGAQVQMEPCANGYNVEMGLGFLLNCSIESQGYPPIYEYSWLLNGNSILNKQQWYNVTQADMTHDGEYTCTGINGIQVGTTASKLRLNVFYHAQNLRIIGNQTVKEGEPLSLTCQAEASPDDITYTWTMKDQEFHGQCLKISHVNINSAGNYKCTAENEFTPCNGQLQKNGSNMSANVTVLYTPKGQPVATISKSDIVVGTLHTLFCNLDKLEQKGVPEAAWVIWFKDENRVNKYNVSDGTHWEGFISYNVSDSGLYSCLAENTIGPSNKSHPVEINIQAPLSFEKYTNNTDNPTYNGNVSGDFIVVCIVSASAINRVNIYQNEKKVSEEFFTIEYYPSFDCNGECSYGLQTANKTQIKWRASEKVFTKCEDVTYYDGDYQCVAESTTVGVSVSNSSEVIRVDTHYGALWNAPQDYQTAEFEQKNVTLYCPVCANPQPQYQWYFNGTDASEIIDGATVENYTLTTANDSTFGLYYCEVSNTINTMKFRLELREAGPAAKPTDLYVLNNMTTSSSLTVQWREGRSGNVPPVTYIIKTGKKDIADCTKDSGFDFVQQLQGTDTGIEGTLLQSRVESLQPETSYCVRIHGENERSGRNTTNEPACICGKSTIAQPNLDNFHIETVTASQMVVTWDYEQRALQNADTIVGLQFEYGIPGENSYTLYPVNDTLNAQLESAEIPGDFDEKSTYELRVHVYEGNNVKATYIEGLNPPLHEHGGVNVGAIVGPLVALILILLVVGLLVYHRQKLGIDKLFHREDNEPLSNTENDFTGEHNGGFDGDAFEMSGYADIDKKESSEENNATQIDSSTVTYAEVDKTKKKTALAAAPVYAEVNKDKKKGRGPVYAEVDKKKKTNKNKSPVPVEQGDNPYDDVLVTQVKPPIAAKPRVTKKPDREVTEDGCVYIKVDFPKYKPQSNTNIIHGKDQMTVYTQIDWTRSADPKDEEGDPPPYQADEEDVMGELPPAREAEV